MNQITIGGDNGQSGSWGAICGTQVHFRPVPIQDYLHYGRRGSVSKRLDRSAFKTWIAEVLNGRPVTEARVFLERPLTCKFTTAMLSSARFFEATIICLEDLGLGYEVVDSGTWQKPILGDVKGSAELKKASLLRGIQLFPQHAAAIKKQKDADGLLLAYHFAR